MWSDRYYYLNIYSDKELSTSFNTLEIRNFLESLKELKKKSDFVFNNQTDFPFTIIILLNARNIDSWSDKDVNESKTNLLSIVCAKSNDEDFKILKETFIKIAKFLNWKLIEEDSENEIKN
ncbi:hypothetical protein GKZ90_0010065 [Flavobacterium sp. MC2016-06]|jgi:hypothetical protein|uniref:hypothetical protein n=1 Tax=Flavobacterium sp. MC2016-06 TaxID=2676308 RepID=UPI0012BA731A|nr:hypothetical protein [Flavobacterium sp. MC2016-06]MBU3859737.1 hypothetical protein [Flavobacterium sp. MC2016-06]